jgi:hypothetical protein
MAHDESNGERESGNWASRTVRMVKGLKESGIFEGSEAEHFADFLSGANTPVAVPRGLEIDAGDTAERIAENILKVKSAVSAFHDRPSGTVTLVFTAPEYKKALLEQRIHGSIAHKMIPDVSIRYDRAYGGIVVSMPTSVFINSLHGSITGITDRSSDVTSR